MLCISCHCVTSAWHAGSHVRRCTSWAGQHMPNTWLHAVLLFVNYIASFTCPIHVRYIVCSCTNITGGNQNAVQMIRVMLGDNKYCCSSVSFSKKTRGPTEIGRNGALRALWPISTLIHFPTSNFDTLAPLTSHSISNVNMPL